MKSQDVNSKKEYINFSTYEYAKLYLQHKLSVIPLQAGDKKPLVSWKEYQERLPNEKEIETWFRFSNANIAIVCGAVSDNLVVIDFDDEGVWQRWYNLVNEKYPELLEVIGNSWLVKTGKGYHLYLRVNIDKNEFKEKFKNQIRIANNIDIKAEGGYVVAPPSLHPSGVQYQFIHGPLDGFDIAKIDIQIYNRIIETIKSLDEKRSEENEEKKERREKTEELRLLSDEEILKINSLLKDAYKPGVRQFLILYLSGWLAKAGIHPVSAVKLVKLLHDTTQDEDSLKERLAAVVYSYKKAGIDVDKFSEEIEKLTGVKPYGLEKEINPAGIKGISGVQEILEKELGEDNALSVLKELQDVIETASPYKDAIFVKVDDSKNLFVVVDFKRKMIRRAIIDGNIQYKERIVKAVPVKVEVYENPVGGITKYVTVWESNLRSKPIVIGPATIDEIISRLQGEGLVIHKRLVEDAVNAVITGFIEKRKAEIKTEIEAPGFYFIDDKIVANRIEIKKPPVEELKEALQLLNELAENWFAHVIDKFATIIKWGIIAPFGFVYKQKYNTYIKWLYLYGASATGKTTLGEIVLSLWGLNSQYVKSGAHIDNIARLGFVLSQSTFPVLINEPGAAIKNNENVIETIKNAIDEKTVRGKFVHGNYVEYPALSLLIFASNKILPNDDALIRRLIVIHFTYDERINEEKARVFEREVKARLVKLKAVGDYISYIILNNNELLGVDWEVTATKLLELAYKEAKLETPGWIYERYEAEENIYDDMRERIRELLYKKFIDEYVKNIGKITDSLRDVVQRVISAGIIPWARLVAKDGYNEVWFFSGLADELRSVIGDITLKGLATLLGWQYSVRKDENGKSIRVVIVKLDDLIDFLDVE